MNTKQVILVRKDLNMSIGKTSAQVGHASMLFLIKKFTSSNLPVSKVINFSKSENFWCFPNEFNTNKDWIYGGMKKVVLGVEDLNELLTVIEFADKLGLENNIIHDEGLDCITCGAIGPDYDRLIDPITNHLKLL
jgi:PTH2 family peptidyl-tRNA hydrolase